ncbi:methyltransferase domain-containing protein [Methanosarcina horonobensis]|uniref:methyltransferase domain-containing protein n=1 Tax=Methanosarcina horonobensis TaxID=418008 RepID=UPI00373FC6CA
MVRKLCLIYAGKKEFAVELKLCDLTAERWPYEDGKFENVIACGIFHFFEKLDLFLKETNRVLKKRWHLQLYRHGLGR